MNRVFLLSGFLFIFFGSICLITFLRLLVPTVFTLTGFRARLNLFDVSIVKSFLSFALFVDFDVISLDLVQLLFVDVLFVIRITHI